MEQLILEEVIQTLRDGGYATERGFPQGKFPTIHGPVCAVNLESADLVENQTKIMVRVLSPMELGVATCEEAALEVGALLDNQGGRCHVSACGFESRTGLFSAEVTAIYAGAIPKVTIDEGTRRFARAFSSWKAVDSEAPDWLTAPWCFELEEWFPAGEPEQLATEGSFTLTYTNDNAVESFPDATWIYQKRECRSNGILQIRRGTSADRTFSRIE